ncbi:hypothetical protein EA473_12630 [Natrarchaeobius chitinivorans]|uniref:Uncharacterized protein n=1 Tax=Natrarchaeobius chitinivorans TaxID=1679083 RepID=A0A3N6M1I3_NATCH|nr:hypothetical protein EA473_12630 [Natrarchaeobius chitinivorans]
MTIVATESYCTPDRQTDRRSVCKPFQLLLFHSPYQLVLYRTTVTGTGARRTIFSATLPRRTRDAPDRP